MIEIIDIVTIFVFAFVMMYYVVNIKTTNIVLQKIYLSVAIFLFCLILELIKSFHYKHISVLGIFQKCFYFAVLTYVAHTTLHDLSQEKLHNFKQYMSDEVILALFIALFIAVGKIFISIFSLGGHKHY